MGRVQFSRLAENDLNEIFDFIALDKHEAASAFVSRLRLLCDRLADHPDMGLQRPRFKGGDLRSFPVNRYLIFYRKRPNGIEIARVLHGTRDLDLLLG